MTDFYVKILGCGSASPNLVHNPSAQVLYHRNHMFLVDCGEGTQLQMRRYGVNFSRIRHIFISHLHGDHMLGLPGLLSTMSLNDVKGEVHVYIFEEGVKWIQEFMRISSHQTTIDIVFHAIRREHALIYEDPTLTVETIPLFHGVPCVGYVFREKPKQRSIRGDMVNFYNVPLYKRAALKDGADYVTDDGGVVPNHLLTLDPKPSLSYAYCSDTVFSRQVVESVTGVTTLYHESTYADDRKAKAKERGHSTARQAAIVAREAGVNQLILGHFSKSYQDFAPFLAQAREEFPDVILANEGMDIPIR